MKNKIQKHEGWRLTSGERRIYLLSDAARYIGMAVFTFYMTSFLALRGVNLTVLAGALLILKIIDAVDDVLFGFFIDKLKIKEWKAFKKITGDGKYLPWFRLTFMLCPLFTIFFYAMPNNIPTGVKIGWFIISYLLYDFSCTLLETPMNCLILTLTDNTEERSHILTMKGIVSVVIAVVSAVALTLLVDPINGPGFSFSSVATGIMIICILLMIPLVLKGKEYNTELKNSEVEDQESYTLQDMWNCVKVNKYMMIYILSGLCIGLTATASAAGSLTSFYLYKGNTMVTTWPLLIAFIPAMILNTQASKIAKKFGRRNSLIILGMICGISGVMQYVLGYENIATVIALGTIGGMANSVRAIFNNFIAPDTIEYTRYKTGKDCSGIFYALNSFVTKATSGIGASVGLFIMALFGWCEVQAGSYDELLAMGIEAGQAAYQTPSAIQGMWIVTSLVPAIGAILSVLVLSLYKLKDKDAELMAQCNAGTITREECEAQLSRKH